MSTSKHPTPGHQPYDPPRDDLADNPGIGSSPGTTAAGADPEEAEGDNTFEGDTENDVTSAGGIDPDQRGRTNK